MGLPTLGFRLLISADFLVLSERCAFIHLSIF
jgi:hypothetical protein